jgi:hypothetical protein
VIRTVSFFKGTVDVLVSGSLRGRGTSSVLVSGTWFGSLILSVVSKIWAGEPTNSPKSAPGVNGILLVWGLVRDEKTGCRLHILIS